MPKTLNFAVVGCGYWGPNLIRNLSSLQDCVVKQVCDFDRVRLKHVQRLYPWIETCSDFQEVVDNQGIDAVVIATPVSSHFDLAGKSLLSGKHTFIEKPMASSVAQCEALIELSENKGLTLMVGHTFIYSATVRKIKEIVDRGDIGEILYISAQRLNLGLFQKDINVVWDLAPHDLSIILHLIGEDPTSVNCQGKAHVTPNIEDVTNLSLSFSHEGFAMIHSSWLDPNKIRRMTIVGSKRMILYDDTEPLEKIKIYDKRVETPPHYDTFAEFNYSYHYGDMYAPHINHIEPLKLQCEHLADCIRTGATPETNGEEGLRVVRILEAAVQSLKMGGAQVKVPERVKGPQGC
jgi:predicted dehydrogenase